MSKPSSFRVPFAADGSLMHYPESWRTIDWRDPEPLKLYLAMEGTRRGRSAAYFMWQDLNVAGRTWPMFITDMADLVRREHGRLNCGIIEATFVIRKRGMNFGIALEP